MIYIGIDLHARHFSMAVLNQDDNIIFEETLPTSCRNLRAAIGAFSETKSVVFEESTLAAWAYRVLQPCAEKVVVADPLHNHWIAGDEKSNDITAARKLAQLLRAGLIHPVHHSTQQQLFKELVLSYHDTSGEVVRFKNKLKAKFRQHGVHCTGYSVYGSGRDEWLGRLPAGGARQQVQMLWESIDHFSGQKQRLRQQISRRAQNLPVIAAFQHVPGIGLIRAATFFAIIDTPHRFANKRKVWPYCGLGVAGRQFDQMIGPKHLTRSGNRRLKDLAKGAAISAIGMGENQYARQYRRLLTEGIKAENARLTVARAIVSTLYAMWRDGTAYQPRTQPSAN